MKNFLDFCKALVLPRKMIRFRKLPFLVSILIIIVATYLAIGSTNIMMKNYVEDDFLINNGELIKNDDKLMNVGDYSISENGEFIATLQPGDNGVYHEIYDLIEDNGKLDITIVFDDKIDISTNEKDDKWFTYFDFEGYHKQVRQEKMSYLLIVYTKKNIFFVNNLGQTLVDGNYMDYDTNYFSIFEKNENSEYIYYLPTSSDELVVDSQYNTYYDTSLWTKQVKKDDVIDFSYDGLMTISPQKRHLKTLPDAVYSNKNRSYVYSELMENNDKATQIKDQGLKDYLGLIYETTLKVEISNEKSVNALMAFGAGLLIPLFLVLISWLFFKRFTLNHYREYMAIFAINYSVLALCSFIIGFFKEFWTYFIIYWIVIIGVYLFTTMRINSIPEEDNDENKDENRPESRKPVEYKDLNKDKNKDYSQIG